MVRLAKQATFGPTQALVAHIMDVGIEAWLNEQFAATGSTYQDIVERTNVRLDYCANNPSVTQCYRNFSGREPIAARFYANAMFAPDQLRQRVAFALSQRLVTSEADVGSTAGVGAYQQIFLTNAFGNYRDILLQVTMNSYMGRYLNMADSSKSAPSENYAREMLQLFSMGQEALNIDGTPLRDSSGGTIPTYTTEEIKEVARALTGWTYARIDGAPASDGNARDYAKPMIKVASRYDAAVKSFFGVTIPAGASQEDSVRMTVEAAFNHPSTPPNVARFMIRHLVTANPSPDFIARVARVFVDNGFGVRGDMKAVTRAILTDSEARGAVPVGPGVGKVKEPILSLVSLMRVVGFVTDGYPFVTQDMSFGQPVFRSPSVFNFYPIDYPLPGSAYLKSPASKLVTTTYVVRLHNIAYNWTVSGDQNRSEFQTDPGVVGWSPSRTDWSTWEAFGADLDGMIARIDLLMLANTMTDRQKAALKSAANAITNADPTLQARRRAQMMLYIVATSPAYLVDR